MRENAKHLFLRISKWLGLFHLARLFTGKALRILCYHGFAFRDEADFRPMLFMTPATFDKRLRFLARHKFPVLQLEDALERLQNNNLPRGATVITIDDGFYGVYSEACPRLQAFGFPATTYVTTYYVQKQAPIFRLAVQYLFWRSALPSIRFHGRTWVKDQDVNLTDASENKRATWEVIDHAEKHCSEDQCQLIAQELAGLLQVDYGWIKTSRSLSLMNSVELGELAARGVDVQLHTHRHSLAVDDEQKVRDEIVANRAVLESIVGRPLRHLCYPSGIWTRAQWPWLEKLDIDSATTCLPGLNYPDTPRLGLRRFLDAENIHPLVFEAEQYGYLELLRRLRHWIGDVSGR
jgi:peptidoglycan/xylan/chitin deacetylase (PgdA/CDA1 family)